MERKYQEVSDDLVLFDEEYYLSVLCVSVGGIEPAVREELFNHLYSFDSNDIELEIDISEEDKGVWYLQLLVPYMLTLADAAKRRIQRGAEQLQEHFQTKQLQLASSLLQGEEIKTYIKRYNPNLKVM